MRLAIVGSVSLAGSAKAYDIIRDVILHEQPTLVVSGGAAGIDSMAAETARTFDIPVQEYRPKKQAWLKDSPDGFHARNKLIAENCDVLVRIVASDSKTYGSGWTRDYAKKLGKRVCEYIVEAA